MFVPTRPNQDDQPEPRGSGPARERSRAGEPGVADEHALARAGQRFLSSGSVAQYAASPRLVERVAVAGNARVSLTSLRGLAEDPDESVRRALLGRPDVTVAMAVELAGDAHWTVRAAAVGTGLLPPAALAATAADPHPLVRRAVAGSSRLPQAAALALSLDPDPRVRVVAAQHHWHRADLDPRALAEWAHAARSAQLLATWNLPPRSEWQAMIIDASTPSRTKVLIAVAARWRVAALEALLRHSDPAVREAVRHNPRMRWSPFAADGIASTFTVVSPDGRDRPWEVAQ